MPSLVSVVEPGDRLHRGFAVVDVEATGSSSRRHRVLELAVVLLDQDLAAEGEFATLIDPQEPVGPTHIHGIAPEQVAGAPLFAGVAARVAALLRGRVLVGHNVGCDRAFLAAEYARIGVRMPAVPEVCTMRLAAQVLRPGVRVPRGLNLRACAAAVGVPGWRPHTALGDARATAALFTRLARLAPGAGELPARLARAAAVVWPEPSGARPELPLVRRDPAPVRPGAGAPAAAGSGVLPAPGARSEPAAARARTPAVRPEAPAARAGAIAAAGSGAAAARSAASAETPAEPAAETPAVRPEPDVCLEPAAARAETVIFRAASAGASAAADALWMRRGTAPASRGREPAHGGGGVPASHGNVSARRSVPDARHGSA